MKKITKILILIIIITLIVGTFLILYSKNLIKLDNSQNENVAETSKTISNENELRNEKHNWTRNGDIITCSICGKSVTIGQEIEYSLKGETNNETKISGEKSGIKKFIEEKNDISQENFGKDAVQTIKKDENTKWVVLGIEDTDKDGEYETLLLISEKPTDDIVYFYGVAGYTNIIEELNRMCTELYGQEARSMTMDDVNGCIEYKDIKGMYADERDERHPTENLETKLCEIESAWKTTKEYCDYFFNGIYYTPEHLEGTKDANELGKYVVNSYYYYLNEDGNKIITDYAEELNAKITEKNKKLVFGENNEFCYFVASIGVHSHSNFASFGPGAVKNGYTGNGKGMYHSNGASTEIGFSIRPVISINSNNI